MVATQCVTLSVQVVVQAMSLLQQDLLAQACWQLQPVEMYLPRHQQSPSCQPSAPLLARRAASYLLQITQVRRPHKHDLDPFLLMHGAWPQKLSDIRAPVLELSAMCPPNHYAHLPFTDTTHTCVWRRRM